jgi:NitT/TauT family transport system permease protein
VRSATETGASEPGNGDGRGSGPTGGTDATQSASPRGATDARWIWRQAWPVLLTLAAILAIWAIVSATGAVSTSSLPSPATVWSTFWRLVRDGTIPTATARTLLRLVIAFGIALILGTLLGIGLSASSFARRSIGALVVALRAVPPIAWLPLAAVWFGLSEKAVVFVAIVGGFPSVTLATSNSLRQVPPLLHRAGQTLGARGWRLYRSIVFPAAIPGYVSGLQLAWGYCWWSLLAGELITHVARAVGLGPELFRSQRHDQAAEVIAILLVIIAIGMVVDLLVFGLIERRLRVRRGLTLR